MLHQRQTHDRERMIVGRHPADALNMAAEAAMDDHLLAVSPRRQSNRLHERPALATSIAGHTQIDVARIETERTVVAMPATAHGRANKGATVSALERFASFRDLARMMMRRRLRVPLVRIGDSLLFAPFGRDEIVVRIVVVLMVDTGHVGLQQFAANDTGRGAERKTGQGRST